MSLRAFTRLTRAATHALHGAAVAMWRFGALDEAQRGERIRWWSRGMLRAMGIALRVEGEPAPGGTLLVVNHVSWLDIAAVHAVCPQARFVSKADVRRWPLVSRLADAAGTLYLERERKRDALRVVHLMASALRDSETVAVFPEGTTSDGRGLLPFHANLLQAAIATGAAVQPVVLRFSDRANPFSEAVEYLGPTTLLQSVWRIARGRGLTAHVVLLEPRAADGAERRALAQSLREEIEEVLRAATRR